MKHLRRISSRSTLSSASASSSVIQHSLRPHRPVIMSFLSSLSPIPSFSAYTGPYAVGTEDLEVPTSQLSPSTSQPPPDSNLSTISFRIFYPCAKEQPKPTKPVYWLPEPQDDYFRAYARFMQASPWLACVLRYMLKIQHGRPLC